jgi:hypothetical protein
LRFGAPIFLVVFSLLRLGTASTTSATTPPRSDKTVFWPSSARIPDTTEACSRASIATTSTDEPCLSSFSCRAKNGVTLLASCVLLQLPPRGGGQPSPRPRGDDDWDDNRQDNGPRRRPSSKASSSSSSLWSRLAKQSAKLSGQAISATARGSGQVAYALLRPKHVEYPELIGLWRLDQWIEDDSDNNDNHHHSDATRTLELTEQFTVLFSRPPAPPSNTLSTTTTTAVSRDSTAKQKQRQQQIPLEFHPAHWPSLATLSFYDDTTKLYYKCTVQRKMADPKVLKLRGKIYKLRSRGGGVSFWKTQNNQQQVISLASIQKKDLIPIGTFVGRRRMKLLTENSNDDDNQDDQGQESDWESDADDYDGNGGDESTTTTIETDKDEQGLPSDSWDVGDELEEGEGTGDKDVYDDQAEE